MAPPPTRRRGRTDGRPSSPPRRPGAEAVELLLSVGAAVDAKRADGATAACAAAAGGHGDVLRRLLDAGADVHVADTLSGESLLHYAARAPTADAVEVALAAGADFGRRSGVGVPTDVSEAYDEGQEPRREDLRGGLTPLMAAAASSSHEALEALLAAAKRSLGSDFPSYVDAVDASGRTALAWAAAGSVRRRASSSSTRMRRETTRRRSTACPCCTSLPRATRARSRTLWT